MLQKFYKRISRHPRIIHRISYNEKIIAIAQVYPWFYRIFYEPIKLVEINIREYLTRQIADRYAHFSDCAAYLVNFRNCIAINDFKKYFFRPSISNPERQYLFQDFMVDMIKKFPYIRAPHKTARMPP